MEKVTKKKAVKKKSENPLASKGDLFLKNALRGEKKKGNTDYRTALEKEIKRRT
jgi:hypothetical protein